jgi:flagellar FliJ protein
MERSMTSHHRFVFGEAQKLTQLTEFQTDVAHRLIWQIEGAIADFDCSVNALNRAIEAEQTPTGIDDPNHFAYSTAAQAMIRRRSNLIRSIDRLKRQLADAKMTPQPTTTSLAAIGTTAL